MDGCDLIRAERERQRAKWLDDHDDGHDKGELAVNAALLAITDTGAEIKCPAGHPHWDLLAKNMTWRKESVNAIRINRLVIAGALIAAEIDRLQRLGEK